MIQWYIEKECSVLVLSEIIEVEDNNEQTKHLYITIMKKKQRKYIHHT